MDKHQGDSGKQTTHFNLLNSKQLSLSEWVTVYGKTFTLYVFREAGKGLREEGEREEREGGGGEETAHNGGKNAWCKLEITS